MKLLSTIAITIIFIELKSILENISIITDTDIWNLAKDRIVAALNLDKKVNTKIGKDEEDDES